MIKVLGKGVTRAEKVSVHFLSNIDITKYFNYEPKFNGVYSRNNLPRIKDGAYVVNLHDKQSNGTHWV